MAQFSSNILKKNITFAKLTRFVRISFQGLINQNSKSCVTKYSLRLNKKELFKYANKPTHQEMSCHFRKLLP